MPAQRHDLDLRARSERPGFGQLAFDQSAVKGVA